MQLESTPPLNQTLAIVSQSNQGVTFELPNQPPRRTLEVNALMQDALDFSLPASNLRNWPHARPAPGTPARVTCDVQPRPETIEQNGWTVRCAIWTGDGNNTSGAEVSIRQSDLGRPQGTNGLLSVRLVLNQ